MFEPVANAMNKNVTIPETPTAASASRLTNLPAIIKSANVYICWNNTDASIGIVKPNISFDGFPVVRSVIIVVKG